MFIVSSNPSPSVLPIINAIKEQMGSVPPHFELLATVNPKRFKMFMDEISYLQNHPNIHADFFAFLRLYVATKERFTYCKNFNTRLLLARKYTRDIIKSVQNDITAIPFDDNYTMLASKAIKAVYEGERFTHEDIEVLQHVGWSQADIYDAVDHAAFLFKNAKILKAYLKPTLPEPEQTS